VILLEVDQRVAMKKKTRREFYDILACKFTRMKATHVFHKNKSFSSLSLLSSFAQFFTLTRTSLYSSPITVTDGTMKVERSFRVELSY